MDLPCLNHWRGQQNCLRLKTRSSAPLGSRQDSQDVKRWMPRVPCRRAVRQVLSTIRSPPGVGASTSTRDQSNRTLGRSWCITENILWIIFESMPGVAQPYGHTWSHVDHQKDCPLRQRQRPALRRSQTHLQNRPTGLDLKKHNNRKHINNQNQNDPKWLCWGTEHVGTDWKWHRCQHKPFFFAIQGPQYRLSTWPVSPEGIAWMASCHTRRVSRWPLDARGFGFWVLTWFYDILCCLMVFLDAALEFSGEKSAAYDIPSLSLFGSWSSSWAYFTLLLL